MDALVAARQTWWQILPLGPTGYGDSPYQCFSAFAGNRYLISPELLIRDGFIQRNDLAGVSIFPSTHVDFGAVAKFRSSRRSCRGPGRTFFPGPLRCVRRSRRFVSRRRAGSRFRPVFGPQGRSWRGQLAGLAARAMLRQPTALRGRPPAIESIRRFAPVHAVPVLSPMEGTQTLTANSRGVLLHRRRAHLRGQRFRRRVGQSGVVPARRGTPANGGSWGAAGYFWRPATPGNPLYNWEALKKSRYAWWIARLRAMLTQVDIVRLDHFRGFEAYWEIPADRPTAEVGRSGDAAGRRFPEHGPRGVRRVAAHRRGSRTHHAGGRRALRVQFHLPGMRILHFAFHGDPYLFAAQLRTQHRRLQRHARQRYDDWLVRDLAGTRTPFLAPLSLPMAATSPGT